MSFLRRIAEEIKTGLHVISRKLDAIQIQLSFIGERMKTMSNELEKLKGEVEENKTVTESAITLINGLSAKIRELADQPQALLALADSMDAQNKSLADAVTANTPATE